MASDAMAPDVLTLWDLLFVMTHVAALQNVSTKTPLGPTREDPIGPVERIRMLQASLSRLGLGQTLSTSETNASDLLTKLERRRELSLPVGGYADELRALAEQVYKGLEQEARGLSVFLARRRHNEDVEAFLADPPTYLGFELADIPELPRESREDFDVAARCYAIGFNTASLLFLLRGAEAVIKRYYCEVIGLPKEQKIKGRWNNWNENLVIPVLRCPNQIVKLSSGLCETRNIMMHARPREASEFSDATTTKTLQACRMFFQLLFEDLQTRQRLVSTASPESADASP